MADPLLVEAWLRGRSIARELPAPVPDRGGWRVDTRSEVEDARYVFADLSPAVADLAREIATPRVVVRACVEGAALLATLGHPWVLRAPAWMMTGPESTGRIAIPSTYSLDLDDSAPSIVAQIVDADGALAAKGHAAEIDGAFVFDRIVCEPAHRRRGLGRALMAALGSARRSPRALPLLVATADGRALYESLGWTVHSPYASAEWAGDDASDR